jgi:hypothetical protein
MLAGLRKLHAERVGKCHSRVDIAAAAGCDKEYIRRLERRALRKVAARLAPILASDDNLRRRVGEASRKFVQTTDP